MCSLLSGEEEIISPSGPRILLVGIILIAQGVFFIWYGLMVRPFFWLIEKASELREIVSKHGFSLTAYRKEEKRKGEVVAEFVVRDMESSGFLRETEEEERERLFVIHKNGNISFGTSQLGVRATLTEVLWWEPEIVRVDYRDSRGQRDRFMISRDMVVVKTR